MCRPFPQLLSESDEFCGILCRSTAELCSSLQKNANTSFVANLPQRTQAEYQDLGRFTRLGRNRRSYQVAYPVAMLTRTTRCLVCDRIIECQRSTRKFCSNACQQKLKRYRATSQCWQSKIRSQNLETDLAYAGLSLEQARSLQPKYFTLDYVSEHQPALDWFIERNEWLGDTGNQISHRFTASYRGTLAGVVLIGGPNFPSSLLDVPERLIQRGACISWSPKGLASRLLMFAIRWTCQNSKYRLFSAYSDPSAGEVGTIYQACGFRYLGQSYGTRHLYRTPQGEVSDRYFRSRSSYRGYAESLGIAWEPAWDTGTRIAWELIPPDIENRLRTAERQYRQSCSSRPVPLKGKYALIVGRDRKETRRLNAEFERLNPALVGLQYPKR
jgi:hypothetical protein